MKRRSVWVPMVAAGVLALALTGGPATAQGGRNSASVPCVRLSSQQQQRIDQIRRDGEQQVQQIQRNSQLSTAQKNEQIAHARQETHNRVLDVLTPAQRQTFHNCAGPSAGARGYGRGMQQGRAGGVSGMVPGVSDLTAEQRSRIAQIRQQARDEMQSVQRDNSLSASQKQQRIASIQERTHSQVLDVLSPSQRTAFSNTWGNRSAVAGSRQERTAPGQRNQGNTGHGNQGNMGQGHMGQGNQGNMGHGGNR